MIPAKVIPSSPSIHRLGFCVGCGQHIGVWDRQTNVLVALEVHRPRAAVTSIQKIAPDVWRISTELTCARREERKGS